MKKFLASDRKDEDVREISGRHGSGKSKESCSTGRFNDNQEASSNSNKLSDAKLL